MAYIAKGNINHNGVGYKAGDIVKDLDEAHANILIEAGAIEISSETVEEEADKENDAPVAPTPSPEATETDTNFPPADKENDAPDTSKDL